MYISINLYPWLKYEIIVSHEPRSRESRALDLKVISRREESRGEEKRGREGKGREEGGGEYGCDELMLYNTSQPSVWSTAATSTVGCRRRRRLPILVRWALRPTSKRLRAAISSIMRRLIHLLFFNTLMGNPSLRFFPFCLVGENMWELPGIEGFRC